MGGQVDGGMDRVDEVVPRPSLQEPSDLFKRKTAASFKVAEVYYSLHGVPLSSHISISTKKGVAVLGLHRHATVGRERERVACGAGASTGRNGPTPSTPTGTR